MSPFELLYGSSPNHENFHPFGCRVYPCLHDYMSHKFSPHSIPCIFLRYSPSHKGFHCLDPTTSKLYITHHAQFDEHHFPSRDGSQAQPSSSLHFLNFLKPSMPHIDPPPMSPLHHSPPITRSESNLCIICPDLVDKSCRSLFPVSGASPTSCCF